MEPSHHMDLGNSLLQPVPHRLDDLRQRVFKRVRVALPRAERAELAGEDANVRVVDVPVENVGGHVPVFPLADDVRDGAQGVQLVGLVEPDRILVRDSLPCQDLVGNRAEGSGDKGWIERHVLEFIRIVSVAGRVRKSGAIPIPHSPAPLARFVQLFQRCTGACS